VGDEAATVRQTRVSETLVCLPTLDEGQTIGPLIDAILALPIAADVLVIDDGSTDGTRLAVETRARRDPRVGLIWRPRRLGLGSAHRLAWLHARRLGYRRIVTMDADMSHDPADIPRLLALLDAGADVAIGSRFAPGGRLDYRGVRRLLSRGGNHLAGAMLRLGLTEHTTSLRAARLDRVPAGLVESIDQNGYAFFLAQARRFVRHGLTVAEAPIHFRDRQAGRSKLPPTAIFQGLATLVSLARLGDLPEPFAPLDEGGGHCAHCRSDYGAPAGDAFRCLACFSPLPG